MMAVESSKPETTAEQVKPELARRRSGLNMLIGFSGMTMALALPIGIYPRVMQNQELDLNQAKMVEQLPTVSVAKASLAAPSRKITLPGTVEPILETAIYARTNGYVRDR